MELNWIRGAFNQEGCLFEQWCLFKKYGIYKLLRIISCTILVTHLELFICLSDSKKQ